MFAGPAIDYDRFIGRYTPTLAVALADVAGVAAGQSCLDVGCGPGGLTRELVTRVGPEQVSAIDPTPHYAAACAERNPGVDVREGVAEHLPWPEGRFDVTLASLVVAFLSDPDRGIREMARVTRPGGTVATCMWDFAGGMTMLRIYWTAVQQVEGQAAPGQAPRPGTTEGDLARRFREAGLADVRDGALTATADYADFDDFWVSLAHGTGPIGEHFRAQPASTQAEIRNRCRPALPADGPFRLDGRAWFACGTVPPAG